MAWKIGSTGRAATQIESSQRTDVKPILVASATAYNLKAYGAFSCGGLSVGSRPAQVTTRPDHFCSVRLFTSRFWNGTYRLVATFRMQRLVLAFINLCRVA